MFFIETMLIGFVVIALYLGICALWTLIECKVHWNVDTFNRHAKVLITHIIRASIYCFIVGFIVQLLIVIVRGP